MCPGLPDEKGDMVGMRHGAQADIRVHRSMGMRHGAQADIRVHRSMGMRRGAQADIRVRRSNRRWLVSHDS